MLDVLAVIDGDVECLLHTQYAAYRVHGEWFDDVDGEIARFAAIHANN